jgi:hypothetical protein
LGAELICNACIAKSRLHVLPNHDWQAHKEVLIFAPAHWPADKKFGLLSNGRGGKRAGRLMGLEH